MIPQRIRRLFPGIRAARDWTVSETATLEWKQQFSLAKHLPGGVARHVGEGMSERAGGTVWEHVP